MVLGSTQPLTEMNTTRIPWGSKVGRYLGLTTLPLSCADCLKILEPRPVGALWACFLLKPIVLIMQLRVTVITEMHSPET